MEATTRGHGDPRAEQAAREARRAALGVWRQVVLALMLVLPLVVRVGCVGLALWAVTWAGPRAWTAFGGDEAAMLPAAIVALPIAGALAAGLGWGGLIAGGLAALGLGWLVGAVDPVGRSLLVVAALGTVVIQLAFRARAGGGDNE